MFRIRFVWFLLPLALGMALVTRVLPAPRAGNSHRGAEVATFGAGCFWGAEAAFRHLPGVVATRVGYAGGDVADPTYEQVCSGTTGHTEVVEVSYDPARISYETLLGKFWAAHDPTVRHKTQSRSVIFYHTPAQRRAAEAAKQRLAASGKYERPVVTEILPAPTFFPAEEYHQHFYEKHGVEACAAGP
jgi:peptide-methionine (S)-S-oxide reductase